MDIQAKYKTTKQILTRIINKGGLYGQSAKLFINDGESAKQFIIECSEQCQHDSIIEHFGKELTRDIVSYAKFLSSSKAVL